MEKDDGVDEDLQSNDYFLVKVHGQIEYATFPGEAFDQIYCKCQFMYGQDWATITNEEGENNNKAERVFISQVACKSNDTRQLFVWDLPIESTLKSTNPFGWPQLICLLTYYLFVLFNEIIVFYVSVDLWCRQSGQSCG